MHGRGANPARAAIALGATILLAGCGATQPTPAYDVRVTYQAVPDAGRTPTTADLEVIRSIVESRLQDTGVAALRVRVEEPDRVVVEFAPASAGDELRALVGTTGRLDFVPLGNVEVAVGDPVDLSRFPPLLSGDLVASAAIGADQTGQRTVDIVLEDPGRRLFAAYTERHVGESFALVLDGAVISAPVIRETITGGQMQITLGGIAGLTLADAQRLATVLRHGQLPFPLREIALVEL